MDDADGWHVSLSNEQAASGRLLHDLGVAGALVDKLRVVHPTRAGRVDDAPPSNIAAKWTARMGGMSAFLTNKPRVGGFYVVLA
jgi:hypothetical protein